MRMPFTVSEFFDVFMRYNHAVWPMQIVLLALALASVLLTYARWRQRSRFIAWALGFLWIWTGLAYHFAQFASINPAARLFGTLCVVQGGLFFWMGARGPRLLFDRPAGRSGLIAWVLIAYALVVYPALNWVSGHGYMGSPTFGAPCPTTIFTIGLLWLVRRPIPKSVLVVPLIWSAIGGSAAFALGVRQDLGLVVAGLSGLWLLFGRRADRAVQAA
jgi:Family of unknown function (DUF6064)